MGLCVAARTANSPYLGRCGRRLRGASRSVIRKNEAPVSRCSRFGSASVGASSEGYESGSSSEETSFGGVLGFRVEMLQNLVSGVWLERRASVVAEVSGRGLARSGEKPLRVKGRCELDPTFGTTERGDQRRAREGSRTRGR